SLRNIAMTWKTGRTYYLFVSLYPEEIRDKSQLSALCFRRIAMAEILSGALKENQCKGLLKLIGGPADGGKQERSRPESRKALSNLRGRAHQTAKPAGSLPE